jgi:hypothetical protein
MTIAAASDDAGNVCFFSARAFQSQDNYLRRFVGSRRPALYTIAERPQLGSRVVLLILPSAQALAARRIRDCSLLDYVIPGKVLVCMSLAGCSGKTARPSAAETA